MIPNILTTVRLVLIPVFAYFMLGAENYPAAALVFVLSGITDVVDGWIARHYQMITNFGKVYDPFVDKLMQLTALLCLAAADLLPLWLIMILLCKELAMIIIGGILYLKKIVVNSHWYGKATTVILYVMVVLMILWAEIPTPLTIALFVLLLCFALFSAGAYLIDIIRHYDDKRVAK